MFHARVADRRESKVHVRWLVLALVLGASLLAACASDEEKVVSFKAQAAAYAEEGKLREAVIEYRNVLQIDPSDVEAHRGLAMAYLQLGAVNDAYWELSETIRLDPDDRESRNTYAAISLANGRYETVLEQAEALLERDPADEVGLVLEAQAYERLGREAEVEGIMRKVIEANPEKTEYRLLLSNFFLRRGQVDEARAEAEASMEIEETYAGAAQMVRVMAADPNAAEATERYLKLAIELAAAEHQRQLAEGEVGIDPRADAYKTAASYYVSRERAADAIALLEQATEALDDAPEARLELMYMLASLYREGGNTEKAAEVMQLAAASGEGNPIPYLVLSTYRTSQGDFSGALEAAEQALAVDPTNMPSRLRYAEALIEYGAAESDAEKAAEGRAQIEAILEESPDLPEALFLVAKVAIAERDFDRAIEVLSSALEAKPDWPQARMLMGTALMSKGEMARARVEMALALELDPTMATARRGLIQIHAALNEHEYAIDQGLFYLKDRPKDAKIRIILAQSLVRLGRIQEAKEMLRALSDEDLTDRGRFALARIELADGNLKAARELLETVEASMPHHVRVLETFVTLDRAENRMAESEARIAEAVELSPEDAELRELQGVVAMAEGDLALAEQSYEKAIELDPKDLSAYSKLASLYSSQGRTDETIAIYEQAVAEDPGAAEAHHFLAVLYEMSGKRDLALQHYEQAIAADDSMAESKNNLAYLLATSGQDLDRALTLAQEAKAAMPGNPNTADTLGWVLLKRGVPSAATGYFREALANMPPDNQARGEVGYHLGLSYAAAGQNDEAIAALQDALDHLEARLDAAQAAGQRVGEPAWASQARAEMKRIAG